MVQWLFQSTPRLVGEGNFSPTRRPSWWCCFNPPPAWSARGTRSRPAGRDWWAVSIHPPLGRRGELENACQVPVTVAFQSTPRLVGEGNMRTPGLRRSPTGFQSTPRLVGEGNAVSAAGRPENNSFNPPPAWSARGTSTLRHQALNFFPVSIHPPLGRRGERG